jgi:hypothetical protein
MNYGVEMTSGDIIYVPRSTNIGSGVHKLFGGGWINIEMHTENQIISQG